MEAVMPWTTWVMPMGYEVDKDLLIAYVDHLLAQLVDTTIERFGTYKGKSLQVHSELQRPVIAKKDGTSNALTGTPTYLNTRAGKEKVAEKEKPTAVQKEKSVETKKEKPSKIQFWRKATEEELDEILANAKSYFRSKKRLTRMLIGETQSVHEETKQIFKKVLALILDEEEEVKEDESKKFEAKDLLKGVKITDFEPDEIVLDNKPMNTQTEPESIPDDDDTGNNDDAGALDNVNVHDIDVEMSEQHEQKQGQEEKKDEEPSVVTQTLDTRPPLIATAMQSRAKKNRMKEQQKEAETIRNVVEILSSHLLETDTDSFVNPIDQLGHLISDAREQMKYFEDAAYVSVEKDCKKKRTEQLMTKIDKGKVALTINKDCLKKGLETKGKIVAIVSKF
ncbi:uncharacterized protein LOC131856733 [Cryptomeria japonica]|uniref:uncharacterized protein LOC131856733 n=1 Tax=Cryptomeria japonica TaxID=3369 RepID=UPI0027DA5E1F|nr:uncharacterized protein LOC131856733 [Cryptomeria japonica]